MVRAVRDVTGTAGSTVVTAQTLFALNAHAAAFSSQMVCCVGEHLAARPFFAPLGPAALVEDANSTGIYTRYTVFAPPLPPPPYVPHPLYPCLTVTPSVQSSQVWKGDCRRRTPRVTREKTRHTHSE
jgi:hypothetical protein